MNIKKAVKQADENKNGKDKPNRTTYRNLFERIKPDEKVLTTKKEKRKNQKRDKQKRNKYLYQRRKS